MENTAGGVSPRKNILAWTDGASFGNPGPAGSAVLIEGKIHTAHHPHTTNNCAEMHAILLAVIWCPPDTNLHIATDSAFCARMIRNRWRAKGDTVSAEDLRVMQEEIYFLCREKKIWLTFTRVKGHSGIMENERVDIAAKDAAKKMRTS